MMVGVYTRAVEKEAEVQTTGFVDDSAVRSKRGKTRRQQWTISEIRPKSRNEMQQKKSQDDCQRRKKKKKALTKSSNKRSSSAPRPLCWLEAR